MQINSTQARETFIPQSTSPEEAVTLFVEPRDESWVWWSVLTRLLILTNAVVALFVSEQALSCGCHHWLAQSSTGSTAGTQQLFWLHSCHNYFMPALKVYRPGPRPGSGLAPAPMKESPGVKASYNDDTWYNFYYPTWIIMVVLVSYYIKSGTSINREKVRLCKSVTHINNPLKCQKREKFTNDSICKKLVSSSVLDKILRTRYLWRFYFYLSTRYINYVTHS